MKMRKNLFSAEKDDCTLNNSPIITGILTKESCEVTGEDPYDLQTASKRKVVNTAMIKPEIIQCIPPTKTKNLQSRNAKFTMKKQCAAVHFPTTEYKAQFKSLEGLQQMST